MLTKNFETIRKTFVKETNLLIIFILRINKFTLPKWINGIKMFISICIFLRREIKGG